MAFHVFSEQKDNGSLWINIILFFACALLAVAVVCYGVFTFKTYLYSGQINALDIEIAGFAGPEDKIVERKALEYKKQLDDYYAVVNNHKISSNLLDFLEQKTVSAVWFSSLVALQTDNEVDLSGQAQTMDALSRQVSIFEQSTDYVNSIMVLSSDRLVNGTVKFLLKLSLNPKVFMYKSSVQ